LWRLIRSKEKECRPYRLNFNKPLRELRIYKEVKVYNQPEGMHQVREDHMDLEREVLVMGQGQEQLMHIQDPV